MVKIKIKSLNHSLLRLYRKKHEAIIDKVLTATPCKIIDMWYIVNTEKGIVYINEKDCIVLEEGE